MTHLDPSGVWEAFAAGFISFASPCLLPLIPTLWISVVGAVQGNLASGSRGLLRPFFHALAFVLGFSAVFVALGASTAVFGEGLFARQLWFARAGGLFVILLGLLMTPAPRNFPLRRSVGGAGSFLTGAAFGFGWTPCVGPVLGSILLIAGSSDSVGRGIGLLSFYSLGLAVPFLLSALLFAILLRFIQRRGRLPWIEITAGSLLALAGLLLATGYFARLTGWMLQTFEPWVDWLAERGI